MTPEEAEKLQNNVNAKRGNKAPVVFNPYVDKPKCDKVHPDAPNKQSKYKNKRCIVDGVKFPSLKEGRRYSELRLMEKAGIISDLQLQVTRKFIVNNITVCSYRSDFEYNLDGKHIVEDVKGGNYRTKEFTIKKALMLACFGIEILIT